MEFIGLICFLLFCMLCVFAVIGLVSLFQKGSGESRSVSAAQMSPAQMSMEQRQAVLFHELSLLQQAGRISSDEAKVIRDAVRGIRTQPEVVSRPAIAPPAMTNLANPPVTEPIYIDDLEEVDAGEQQSRPQWMEDSVVDAALSDIESTSTPGQAPPTGQPTSQRVPEPAYVHPLDREDDAEPISAPQPSQPSVPRKALAELLVGFMQERNIRWIELISGMLIVGSAIGLVVSLRTTLQDTIPYFPAILFMLITSAIWGAGLYTLKKWDLAGTSRGVLIITLLLVPLNLAAAVVIGQSEGHQPSDVVYWLALIIGLGVSGTIVWTSATNLVKATKIQLAVGVFATAVGQLFVARLGDLQTTLTGASVLMILPLVGMLAATAGVLPWGRSWQRINNRRAFETLLTLGVSVFAFAVCLGLLLVYRGEISFGSAVANLTPTVSVALAGCLAIGLLVQNLSIGKRNVHWRITGVSIAVLAGIAMVGMLWSSRAKPELLIAVSVLDCVLLVVLAWLGRLAWLNVPAVQCAALGWLVGMLWVIGGQPPELEVWPLAKQPLTSILLIVPALLAGLICFALRTRQKAEASLGYGIGGGLLAAVSVITAVLAELFGGGAWYLPPLLILVPLGILIANGLTQRIQAVSLVAAIATALGLADLLAWNPWWADELGINVWKIPTRLTLTLLSAGSLITLVTTGIYLLTSSEEKSDAKKGLGEPAGLIAALTLILALPLSLFSFQMAYDAYAATFAVMAVCYLLVAWTSGREEGGIGFGVFAPLATVFATAEITQRFELWNGNWFLQAFVMAIVCLLVIWSLALRLVPPGLGQKNEDGNTADKLIMGGWNAWSDGWLALAFGLAMLILIIPVTCASLFELQLGSASVRQEMLKVVTGSGIAWSVTGLVMLAVGVVLFRKHDPLASGAGALLALVAMAAVLAGECGIWSQSVATACRWSFAGLGLLLIPSFALREKLESGLQKFGLLQQPLAMYRLPAMLMASVPTVLLTVLAASLAIGGNPPVQPVDGSLFAKIGTEASYLGPMVLVVVTLVSFAWLSSSHKVMFAAAMVLELGVALACMLVATMGGEKFNFVDTIGFLSYSSMAMGLFAGVWLLLSKRVSADGWLVGSSESPENEIQRSLIYRFDQISLWDVVWLLAAGFAFVVGGIATVGIVLRHELDAAVIHAAGSWQAFAGWGIAVVMIALVRRRNWRQLLRDAGCLAALPLAGMVAAAVVDVGDPRSWFPDRVLTAGWLAILTAGAVWIATQSWLQARSLPKDEWKPATRLSVSGWIVVGLALVLAVISLVTAESDPLKWWPTGTLLISSVAIYLLSVGRVRQLPTLLFPALIGATAFAFWLGYLEGVVTNEFQVWAWTMFGSVAVATAILEAHQVLRQRLVHVDRDVQMPSPCLYGLHISVGYFLFCLLGAFTTDFWSFNNELEVQPGSWITLAITMLLPTLLLWDRNDWVMAPTLLYFSALSITCLTVSSFTLESEVFIAVLPTAIAACHLILAAGWNQGDLVSNVGHSLGMAQMASRRDMSARLLTTFTAIAMLVCSLLSLILVFNLDVRWLRLIAAIAPGVFAITYFLYAESGARNWTRYAALAMAVFAGVLISWADLTPDNNRELILSAAVRAFVVLAAATAACLVGPRLLPRMLQGWPEPMRVTGIFSGAASGAALVVVLVLEVTLFDPRQGAPIHFTQVMAVAIALVAISCLLVWLAVRKDDMGGRLTIPIRHGLVYGAQIVAAITVGHVYLARPMLFTGVFAPYWPFVIVVLAMAAVGIGEVLRRRGYEVLGQPLQRSGVFLPLIPCLSLWLIASENGIEPMEDGLAYAALLFLAGSVYVLVATLRGSMLSACVAAAFGNFAIWAVMGDFDLSPLAHPQFWLIPPAISVLVASQWNKDKLSPSALASIRYSAMLVLYISSAGEVFMRAAQTSLWPPIILAAIAVLGVFAGVMLQVRAFLITGTSFLFLALVSLVWQASQSLDHSWPWWALGISTGLAILVLFGIFEKKRPEMLAMLERLKSWER